MNERILECIKKKKELDEIFLKDFLRRVFVQNEVIDSKDEIWRKYQDIKRKMDPDLLFKMKVEIALEKSNTNVR